MIPFGSHRQRVQQQPNTTTKIKSFHKLIQMYKSDCGICYAPRVSDLPRNCAKMYAQYWKPDDVKTIRVVRPQLMFDPFGVVDGEGHVDNGLGFGQGSTAGVITPVTTCTGFQRSRRLANLSGSCHSRNAFNLKRSCTSAYKYHLDTEPNCGVRFL